MPDKIGIREYFKGNISAVFVIIFMVLIACSAVFLVFGNQDVSERLSNWGFNFLLIGLLLKIINLKKACTNEDM